MFGVGRKWVTCVVSEVPKAQKGKRSEPIDWGSRPHWWVFHPPLGWVDNTGSRTSVKDSKKFMKPGAVGTQGLLREGGRDQGRGAWGGDRSREREEFGYGQMGFKMNKTSTL